MKGTESSVGELQRAAKDGKLARRGVVRRSDRFSYTGHLPRCLIPWGAVTAPPCSSQRRGRRPPPPSKPAAVPPFTSRVRLWSLFQWPAQQRSRVPAPGRLREPDTPAGRSAQARRRGRGGRRGRDTPSREQPHHVTSGKSGGEPERVDWGEGETESYGGPAFPAAPPPIPPGWPHGWRRPPQRLSLWAEQSASATRRAACGPGRWLAPGRWRGGANRQPGPARLGSALPI